MITNFLSNQGFYVSLNLADNIFRYFYRSILIVRTDCCLFIVIGILCIGGGGGLYCVHKYGFCIYGVRV
ncbi:hypothetical protein [Moraxella lacunata]|uniref:hypothetical protein n=1 Tax=Moraxella lacunata TaxID=477 RepID=UPI003EDFD0AD